MLSLFLYQLIYSLYWVRFIVAVVKEQKFCLLQDGTVNIFLITIRGMRLKTGITSSWWCFGFLCCKYFSLELSTSIAESKYIFYCYIFKNIYLRCFIIDNKTFNNCLVHLLFYSLVNYFYVVISVTYFYNLLLTGDIFCNSSAKYLFSLFLTVEKNYCEPANPIMVDHLTENNQKKFIFRSLKCIVVLKNEKF